MIPIIKRWFFVIALWFAAASVPAQTGSANPVLILYDSGTNTANAQYGWIGNIHAKFLANLLGHFDLNYTIEPVENYQAGQIASAPATFYLGLIYDNPLPAAFTNDVTTTTNPVCWIKYNLWQVSGNIYFPQPLDSRIGFRFISLDESGYTNIVYKGITLQKHPLDPELGLVSILDTNLASSPAVAWRTNADGSTSSMPYITHGSNFWYVGDSPFDYMGEQDRYLAFCDALHDILGINAPESHRAIIRLEDVTMNNYAPSDLTSCVDYLHSNNVPFAMATIPYYTDPFGYYNNGVPETHRISDTADAVSTAMVTALRHAVASGGQILMHGYTHQYSNVPNPYTAVSADDFEFWRETLVTVYTTNNGVVTTNFTTGLYQPLAEDSTAWASGRLAASGTEFKQTGLSWVGWVTVHYTASATDYQVFATNFPVTMQRAIYFADDYDPTNNPTHLGGQLFPYVIDRDIYGQKIMGETCGDYEPQEFENFAQHSVTDILNAAHAALVVRDGWANAFYHGFYGVSNLQQIVTGIQALGYTYVPLSSNVPPSIVTEPASRVNNAGTTATFTTAAVGTAPLSYQWFFGTNLIAGATNATLSLAKVQTNNAGSYAAVVSNPYGSVVTAAAALTINLPPVITTPPQSQVVAAGASATFTVVATGGGTLGYQWQFNGTNAVGGNSPSLTLTNVQAANAGSYTVVVTNAYGSATSAAATLTLGLAPAITAAPQSRTNNAGTTATFSVTVSGTAPLSYQWTFNGANLSGATAATLTLANVQTNNAGSYAVAISNPYGSITSAPAALTVNLVAPVITAQPQSLARATGTTASFSVTASGTAPLRYQWRFNGVNILNATNATYTIGNVRQANAGNYTVVVSNVAGSVTSATAVLSVGTAPVITGQPQNLTVTRGSVASFTVLASGSAPLRYQWRFNGANLLNATNATYTLLSAQTNNAGKYSAVVSNPFGSATSANATLTVR
jgi:uncharacterized protein YdaL